MGPNRRAQDRERAAAEAAAKDKRAEAERKAAPQAQKIVAIWNAREAWQLLKARRNRQGRRCLTTH